MGGHPSPPSFEKGQVAKKPLPFFWWEISVGKKALLPDGRIRCRAKS